MINIFKEDIVDWIEWTWIVDDIEKHPYLPMVGESIINILLPAACFHDDDGDRINDRPLDVDDKNYT